MSFGELPDLAKIGKRIGKRLKDILNPPVDNGPSKEERRAQRLRDSLKGLVYFDNFDEIHEWRVGDVDPVQQANIPLLERSASQVFDQPGPTSRVLLCHDYSGGYHEWEGVRPPAVKEKPYSCNYFQYVETFVYFSHKIVCIPPASWTNACHRNGVKVLGTFMMEGDGKAKSIERMFDEVGGEYVVVKRLASMAQAYGFDGWLLNVEAEFPYAVQHPISNLTAFIRSLKRSLGPSGIVVWYDAITKDNEVDYQNALNWKNVEFALAADVLFTNYKWTEQELHETKAVAEQHGIKLAEVYFGIDVWAQNTSMPGPPRVTYPPKGGGGTLTGLATHVLSQEGFSSAIFGPGWPYEHFSSSIKPTFSTGAELNNAGSEEAFKPVCTWGPDGTELKAADSEAEAVERSMWEGTRLPYDLACDCKKGHPHHRPGYQDMPIIKAAREWPAGSSSFLETNFQQPFCLAEDGAASEMGNLDTQGCNPTFNLQKHCYWIPVLGLQAPLPHLWQKRDTSNPALHAELRYHSSPFLHVDLIAPITSDLLYSNKDSYDPPKTTSLCLFKLNLATEVGLEAKIRFKWCSCTMPTLSVGFYTKSILPGSERVEDTEYEISCEENSQLQTMAFALDKTKPTARIMEVGIYCKSAFDVEDPRGVLDLYGLVIRPKVSKRHTCSIGGPEIYHRTSGSNSETRLRWTWNGSKYQWPAGLPWSTTTGPFSVFTIVVEGRELGQAHCLEFPLRSGDIMEMGNDVMNVTVTGHLFGGGIVSNSTQVKLKADILVRHLERSTEQL